MAEPAAFITETIEEANCLRCHDEENSPTFAFTSFMEKSRHFLPEPVKVKEIEKEEVEEPSMMKGEKVLTGEIFDISTHTVRKGDSLWSLSEHYLGEGVKWNELYEANRKVLSDPDNLLVGLEMRIPQP